MIVSRLDSANWETGRADMLYRDLIPERFGGRVIASHIRVPGSGPVPDWVHYHRVQLQMIFCWRGRVKVVYEDQGPPFVLEPGDCVLQPPQIRHRVLESSELEVVEITCPADHETLADETMQLPTAQFRPERLFGGQRFVRHIANQASYQPWLQPGFEYRDIGIAAATSNFASAQVVRCRAGATPLAVPAERQQFVAFVLRGSATVGEQSIAAGDCIAGETGSLPAIARASSDFELLSVAL